MNIILELEELDDLIVKFTKAPVTTALQGKLRPIIDAAQVESQAWADTKIKHEQLQAELTRLKTDVKVKEAQSAAKPVPHMGVLWKRSLDGFEPNPYCPKCPNTVLIRNPPNRNYYWYCSSCRASFPGDAKPPSI
jgi:hypothetical protein